MVDETVDKSERLWPGETLQEIEDILPEQDSEYYQIGKKVVEWSKGYGLRDMHQVTQDILELRNSASLNEVLDNKGKVMGYEPSSKIVVTEENAIETLRKYSSSMVVCYALVVKNKFRVHWDTHQEESPFGAEWINGYYVFNRGDIPRRNYMNLMERYIEGALEIQDWYGKRVKDFNDQIDKLD